MRNFINGLRMGIREIIAHPGRSLLTMLGIVLGVVALVGTISIVNGMFVFWEKQLEAGGGLFKITVSPDSPPARQADIADRSPGLTLRDVEALERNVSHAVAVSAEINERRFAVRNGERSYNRLHGVGAVFFPMHEHELHEGRLLTDTDVAEGAAVVVLGYEARSRLFPDQISVVGQVVTVFGKPFTVVGVLKDYEMQVGRDGRGSYNALWWKNQGVFIPISSMWHRLKGLASERSYDTVSRIHLRVDDVGNLHRLVEQATNTLLFTHEGISDFDISTEEENAARIEETKGTYFTAMGGVAAISLVVGGIGIMNVMLASISERLREIGIRKAVGATNFNIFVQVVVEAVTISLLGGVLGVLCSVHGVGLLSDMLEGTRISPQLNATALAIGFGFSVFIGILSGIYPAIKAARLDPIDALRYE